jgi:hypothetical protein
MRTKFWSENLKERDRLENIGVDGRIMLKRILNKLGGGCGLHSSGSGYGPVVGWCEHSNEPFGSIKSE